MTEREEFALPLELTDALAKPLAIALPDARSIAGRAIAQASLPRFSAVELRVYAFAAALFALGLARVIAHWWRSLHIQITIPLGELSLLTDAVSTELSRMNWTALFGGLLLGVAAYFSFGLVYRQLSE